MKNSICVLIVLLVPSMGLAQAKYPHVDEIIKEYDSDGDELLTTKEVEKSQRYSRQFPRWDADKNGKVSAEEITKMRAKFGIAADGTMKPTQQRPIAQSNQAHARKFTIPEVEDLIRIDRSTRPSREQASNSEYIFKTKVHPVDGDRYVVITDHKDGPYMDAVKRFSNHYNAKLYRVPNLSDFYTKPKLRENIGGRLARTGTKYVAIAPRLESFSENVVLAMWEMLSTFDDDPQIDCFPGFLVASNPESLERLINQSISHEPITSVKPFAINQVQNNRETRSLQKSGILRKYFQKADIETPIVAIYSAKADTAPRLDGGPVWNMKVDGRKQFVKEFPMDAGNALEESNLIVMHGHGIPGMSCSMDVDGIPGDMAGKVLLSGSCFSASPTKSDLPKMGQAPGGYDVEQRDAFVIRAVDNGAVVAFGHQRLSSGFPHLYPVLEHWMKGESVGQAYQQLLNALIESTNTKSGGFIISDEDKNKKRLRQNSLLYVVIGDPALIPFEPQLSLR